MREYITAFVLLFILVSSVVVLSSYREKMEERWKEGQVGEDEVGLVRSRASITRAILARNCTSRNRHSYIPRGSICHNPYYFVHAQYATIDQQVFENLIRVLCNANSSEGFNPTKDVPLPEFNLRHKFPVPVVVPSPPSAKSMLAFFAGGNHGIVFKEWKGKDSQVQVFEYLLKGLNYREFMIKSKYCLCPSGYDVASPRITESILAGCSPVPISDSLVLPFSDVLGWTQFSVPIPVSRIPEIKNIVSSIPERTYLSCRRMCLKVQRHFTVNRPAKRFDVTNMLLHFTVKKIY